MQRPILLSMVAMLSLHGLGAEDKPPKKEEKQKEIPSATVIVSANKYEVSEKELTTTVSVKTEQEIDQKLISNLLDLTKFEPGVDVSAKPDRQGATSYSIRGIGGNRVLILVDGVNLPDGPEAGRNFSRDFVDLDSLKRVEILRGPSSALYGSDAIGGVVTYTTKDARDYLPDASGIYTGLKIAYAGANEGTASTLTVAGVRGKWDGLFLSTVRTGYEIKPAIGTPNEITFSSSNFLGKVGYSPNEHHKFNLSAQLYARQSDSILHSLVGPVAMGINITAEYGDDSNKRNQFTLGYTFDNNSAFFQHADMRLFYQGTENIEKSEEHREHPAMGPTPASSRIRFTDYRFKQEIFGLRSHAEKRFIAGAWPHRLLFGLDLTQTETSRPYDRTENNLTTGESTKEILGVLYPSKVMPDSTTTTGGAYIQGEIYTPTASWAFIPALRFDYYNLSPHPDQEFQNSNIKNLPVASISNFSISPKFGVIRTINPTWSLYGQYAHGFRNPAYDNVNMSMSMMMGMQRITIEPNHELKPETCDSIEMGVHGGYQANWSFSSAIFYSNYSNFITDVRLTDDPDGSWRYQFQNLQKVRIYGAEAKAALAFTKNLFAQATLAYSRGDDLTGEKSEPLDSIAPIKGVLGFGYKNADRWGFEGIWTLSEKKTRVPNYDFQNVDDIPFEAPGFGLFDLMGHFSFKYGDSQWRIQAGIFNVFDKVYWRWEDVRGFTAGHSDLPRYSQPGRNFSLSLVFSWK